MLTLFVCTSVLLALRSVEHDSASIGLYLLLGVSTLCRVDAAVFAASLLVTLTLLQPRRWKAHLLGGGCVLVIFLLAQAAFNFDYYGMVLPNTYYLKMTGYPLVERVRRGASVAGTFMFPLIPLIAIVVLSELFIRRCWQDCILLVPLIAQVLYSIWVGGDAWEDWGGANRYDAIVMPLFLILVALGFTYLASLISYWMRVQHSYVKVVEQSALACLVGLGLLLGNQQHLLSRCLLAKPMQTSRPESDECNEDMVRQALLIRSLTDADAHIAVVWAGSIPYFARRFAIDLLGKNDAKIAHEEMRTDSDFARKSGFYPGHLKWDYAYSIGQLKPDLVAQIWGVEPENLPWLSNYVPIAIQGFHWYVRRDSRHLSRELSDLLTETPKRETSLVAGPADR